MERDFAGQARVFRALCDERRLRILELLKQGEACACHLGERLGFPQSSLAYHMKILCESGIVLGRQEGKWMHYRISESGCAAAIGLIEALMMPAEPSAEGLVSLVCD